jgi:2-dehydro-3-deoxygluconokinase
VKVNTKPEPLLVGFGEAMIRLSAPERAPLRFSKELTVGVAGSELNVLVTASALGLRTRWLTRLPANELGQMIRRHALSNDVEVVASDETGARAGLFFYECGVPPRPSNVIYDRDNSATSHVDADEFDWDQVLGGASGAHVTGITCALGKGPLEATIAFLTSARSLGVTTSFDMNYRSQLWDIGEARSAYFAILPLVDTLFLAPSDLTLMLDQQGATDDMASAIKTQFDIKTLVIRERQALSSDELSVSVRVFGENESTVEASGVVVDEIGAGDAAAGAFLSSMLSGGSNRSSTERAARAYARMLTIPGDTWTGSLHDLTGGYVVSRTVVR